jgi:hypothetical protein
VRQHETTREQSGSHGGRAGPSSRPIAFPRRCSSTALLIALTALWAIALSHHPVQAQLRGAQLCLDASSVDAAIEAEGGTFTGARATDVRDAVHDAIASTLDALRVPWHEDTTCAPSSDRLLASFHARYLDPETYRNFPDRTFSLVISLLIEPAVGSDRTFVHVVSELYSESEQVHAIDAHLVRRAQEAAVQLAVAWWEANPPARRPSNMTIAGFATALSVLSAVLAYTLLRRRRGART